MERKKHIIDVKDFGKKGDLDNGWGYCVYLNENGKKSFEQNIFIYGFDSHIVVGCKNETEYETMNLKTKEMEPFIEKKFPVAIRDLNEIEKAEKIAYERAVGPMVKGLSILLFQGDQKAFQVVDLTERGKNLLERSRRAMHSL